MLIMGDLIGDAGGLVLVIRTEDLPFIGSSHRFAGSDHGNVAISMFLVEAKPGRDPMNRNFFSELKWRNVCKVAVGERHASKSTR